ncbi:MAG: DUF1501 domain-containing protein, partial [Planctomycetaceae bacterium]|nr:DUF1501 domain-containing protein [Planctomycetaceae bacterium]
MHCGRFISPGMTRRSVLERTASGFGAAALTALMATDRGFGAADNSTSESPFAPREPMFPARAKHVIFLYMDGGPSQVDTFDPKPALQAENGRPFKMEVQPTQFDNVGNTLGSPWEFRPGGESGLPVSDLFPFVRECADELCVIRSLTSDFSEHTNANYFLHSGH